MIPSLVPDRANVINRVVVFVKSLNFLNFLNFRFVGEYCSVACDYMTACNGHGVCNE